jgi:hypothetical protein
MGLTDRQQVVIVVVPAAQQFIARSESHDTPTLCTGRVDYGLE